MNNEEKKYVEREVEKSIEKLLKLKKFFIVKGPRQAGKTTLFKHLAKKLKGTYISLEDSYVKEIFCNNVKHFAKEFIKEGEKTNIFIDELQLCSKAGRNLKFLYDFYSENVRIFATGSGTFDNKVDVSGPLLGRSIVLELLTFSFSEFLSFKDKDLYSLHKEMKKSLERTIFYEEEDLKSSILEKEFFDYFQEYCIFGSYPEVCKTESIEEKKILLKNIVESYIEKDALRYFSVKSYEKFKNFASYLAYIVGNIAEFSNISKTLRIDYNKLHEYYSILRYSYICHLLNPFKRNLVTELKKSKKVYFFDLGFRNALINNFLPLESRNDKGQIVENFVFRHLWQLSREKMFNLYYWRTTSKAEVDFVIEYEGKVIPIEVKSLAVKASKSLKSFINNYKVEKAIVFCLEKPKVERYKNANIYFVPAWYL